MKPDSAPVISNMEIKPGMSELEKFKRRLIRAVERLLIKEKKPEEEVWQLLKKETGNDTQNIWARMKSLTLKKLQRLLQANDVKDAVPPAAQMSQTDWLMVDLVLVHQDDVDLIGKDEELKEDRKVLVDLFDLVEKLEIEFKHGNLLADAWADLTFQYNLNGRACSPMLLQRRWYQLKLATRETFYRFWYDYRGSASRLGKAAKPSHLLTCIAKRYKQLVICEFVDWAELINQRCIIMHDEFENALQQKSPKKNKKKRKKTEDNTDLVVIEPVIETINLDDSDKEDDNYDELPPKSPEITIKEEPIDPYYEENYTLSNTEKKSIYDEVLESLEQEDIDAVDLMEEDMDAVDLVEEDIGIEKLVNNTVEDMENKQQGNNTLDNDNVVEIGNVNDITLNKNGEILISDPVNDAMDGKEPAPDLIPEVLVKSESEIEPTTPKEIPLENYDTLNEALRIDPTINDIANKIVLPQITHVFGNVNVSNEAISKIATMTELRDNIVKECIEIDLKPDSIKEEIKEMEIEIDNKNVLKKEEEISDILVETETLKVEFEKSEDKLDIKPNNNQFSLGDISNDINFADDGIEFLDDGIEDDEDYTQADQISEAIKAVVEKAVEHIEEPKIDKKLLLCPTVYLLRLEQLGIPSLESFDHVNDTQILNTIDARSKPILKTTNEDDFEDNDIVKIGNDSIIEKKVGIKTEMEESGDENCDNGNDEDDDSHNDGDYNIKKIKLTSSLLQKPRSRDYNPIQLCKNPDFNTRLKRLNVGFFGYPTNCVLLKSCKPLTVDLSKAFETRLLKGTMYLEPSDQIENVFNLVDNDVENLKSVVPSSMPVQSLIDNTQEADLVPPHEIIDCEVPSSRNKVINLPDISEIRRINQKLLTAEVTPIINNNKTPQAAAPREAQRIPPKQYLQNNNISKTIPPIQKKPGPKCKKTPLAPWTGFRYTTNVPWIAYSKQVTPIKDEALLTLDALNKMLFVLSNEDDEKAALFKIVKKKIKKNREKWAKAHGRNISNTTNEVDATTSEMCEIETGDKLKTDTEKPRIPKENISSYKKKRGPACCWAALRLECFKNLRKRIRKHFCPFPICNCCCRFKLEEYVVAEFKLNKEVLAEMSREQRCHFIHRTILTGHARQETNQSNINTNVNDVSHTSKVFEPVEMNNDVASEVEIVNDENTKATTSVTINLDSDDASDTPVLKDSNIFSANKDKDDIDTHRPRLYTTGINAESDEIVSCANKSLTVTSETGRLQDNPEPDGLEIDTRAEDANVKQINVLLNTCETQTAEAASNASAAPPVKVNIFSGQPIGSSVPFKVISGNRIRPKIVVDRGVVLSHRVKPTDEVPRYSHRVKGLPKYIIPKSSSSKNPNEKVIYLNKKNNAGGKKSDLPICLGNNKILLTTVKFPLVLKYLEEFKNDADRIIYLPQGVELTLLPNNVVSYILDPNNIGNPQELALLPEIITLVQKKINELIGKQDIAIPVINLDVDVASVRGETDTFDNRNMPIEPVDSIPKSVEENVVLTDIDNLETDTISNIDMCENIENSEESSNQETRTETINNETTNNLQQDRNNIETAGETNAEHTIQQTSKNNETRDISQPKNILSDLMEMSGISAEDFAPPQQAQIPAIVHVQPLEATISLLEKFVRSYPSEQELQEEPCPVVNTPCGMLSPVTSFMQLKYAVANNGSFFKLDLNTGVLVTINVAIKQKSKGPAHLPAMNLVLKNSVIDLTEEDSQTKEAPVISVIDKLQETPSTSVAEEDNLHKETMSTPSKNGDKSPNSLLKPQVLADRSILIDKHNVKPIKLFKSNVPNVLRMQLKRRYDHVFRKIFKNTGKSKNVNTKRKQTFSARQYELDSDNCIELDSSDELPNTQPETQNQRSLLKYTFDEEHLSKLKTYKKSVKHKLNTVTSDVLSSTKSTIQKRRHSSDSSSDDEPLSLVAKRNKVKESNTSLNETATENNENANNDTIDNLERTSTPLVEGAKEMPPAQIPLNDKDIASTSHNNDNNEEIADDFEESSNVSLIEEPMQFSDDSDDEGHCILGV